MNTETPTPETDSAYIQCPNEGAWDFRIRQEKTMAKLERERDEWKAKYIQQNKDLGHELRDPNGTIWSECKRLQTELDAVTKQRDKIDLMYHKIIKEVLECDPIPACKRKDDQLEPPWEVIARVREQRDRLAEALKNISSGIYAWHTCVDKLAPEALLLTPNEL